MTSKLFKLGLALICACALTFVSCGEAADAAGDAANAATEMAGDAANAAGDAAAATADAASDAAAATAGAVGDAADATVNAAGEAVDAVKEAVTGEGPEHTSAFVCPMHCEGSGAAEAGKCPKCKMDYVANADHAKDAHEGHDHN